MSATTPESAPEKKEALSKSDIEKLRKLMGDQEAGKKTDKEKKNPGTDEAIHDVTDAQRKQIIEKFLSEQHQEEGGDIPHSLYSTTKEKVREPIEKWGKRGLFVLNPVAFGTIWGVDALARRTISKIPIVGQLYEKPRAIITGTAARVRDVLAAGVALPAGVVDTAEDIFEVATGTIRQEARGPIEKVREFLVTKTVLFARKGVELVKKGADKSIELVKFLMEMLKTTGGAAWAPVKAAEQALSNVLPAGGKVVVPLIKTGLLVYGIHLLGMNVLPKIIPGGDIVYTKFLDWLTGLFRGV